MARKQIFLAVDWSDTWRESYFLLPLSSKRSCDEVVLAIVKQETTPGHRVKPILPQKHYLEARINSGDRIVFRVEDGTVRFVDIVKHDDIDRYGRRSVRSGR